MSTRRSRYLISVRELRARLDDPTVRVVDVRWSLEDPDAGRSAYSLGHVAGAAYLSWLDDLSDPEDSVQGQLAPPQLLSSVLSAHGIGAEHEVVVYDDGGIFMAPRLLWALHEYGHDRVRVLDGGWPPWVRSGAPIERGLPARPRPAAAFAPSSGGGLRVTKHQVLDAVRAASARVVDCRMDETYEAAGSHIPGASRMPAPSLFDHESGLLLPDEELRALALEAGVDGESPVILYCGGGVSASAAFMALRIIGIDNAVVYDGSWTEWGADPSLPKESHRNR